MKRNLNKLIILILGFVFGISQEVAAQYGIVTCHYKMNGEVKMSDCDYSIPGIKISLKNARNGAELASAVSNSKGTFDLSFSNNHMPNNLDSLQLYAIDTDGTKNWAEFDSSMINVTFKGNALKTISNNEWDKSYEYVEEILVGLKPKENSPCDDRKKSDK
jgi:putative lipoprotein (rSAM/lipoprotein system)